MDHHLLTARSALVLLLGLLTGVAAGVLTLLSGGGTARSVLCGAAAAGLAVGFFNRLVAPDLDAPEAVPEHGRPETSDTSGDSENSRG
ncbi:hypothetical protein [Streptomyces daliensis]